MNAQPDGASLSPEGVKKGIANKASAVPTAQLLEQQSKASDSAAYVWYVIGLLTIVNCFNYIDRMALSVLLPSIKADMALSDGQLGILVGFAFALFYAVSIVPI